MGSLGSLYRPVPPPKVFGDWRDDLLASLPNNDEVNQASDEAEWALEDAAIAAYNGLRQSGAPRVIGDIPGNSVPIGLVPFLESLPEIQPRQRGPAVPVPSRPPDDLFGVATDLPGGGWDQRSAEGAPSVAPVATPPENFTGVASDVEGGGWNQGAAEASLIPPEKLTDLGAGLTRREYGGLTGWTGDAHEGLDELRRPVQYGSIAASMNTWTPGHEDLTGLKRHAVNAADFQVPNPVPPPPVPTTITSARFDQKEGFVPLGPPTGTTGVRESYQGVPTDPEEERQRRMEREAQNLQLEEMRQKVRDPYGKERFDAEQRRGDIVKKAELDQMGKEQRTRQYLQETRDLEDYSRRSMDGISRLNIPEAEKKARIAAAEERLSVERQRIREAYGIDARYNRETP